MYLIKASASDSVVNREYLSHGLIPNIYNKNKSDRFQGNTANHTCMLASFPVKGPPGAAVIIIKTNKAWNLNCLMSITCCSAFKNIPWMLQKIFRIPDRYILPN